jgi:hypothetical protein
MLNLTQPQNSFRNYLDASEASDGMKSGQLTLFHIHAITEAIDHLCVGVARFQS